MNPELPNSLRSALAQQGSSASHPSADMLTAFAEHTLSTGENGLIADHLARCTECREVLFLASNADEHYTAEAERAAKVAWTPRPTWKVAWTAFVAAGIVIVGGIFLGQYVGHEKSDQKVVQVVQMAPDRPPIGPKSETSNLTTTTAEAEKPAHAPKAKALEARRAPKQSSDTEAVKSAPASAPESPAAEAVPKPNPANQPSGNVMAGSRDGFQVAVPTRNAFAEPQDAGKAKDFAVNRLTTLQSLARPGSSATKTWRVTPDGQLEHFSQTEWARVLTDRPVKFRVVAESSNGVWAGGDHGELFHSEDSGEHWSEIALPVPPAVANDAIVAIHFIDQQQGIILTESGARYGTSDGGKNWRRE